ncbi:uncharacterized protein LOC110858639 isoform X2 [Folsomia candida]|uniref:F-box domain-containing protein n=2 Tax=Folsomia candida TaxID=158441 RepID=A0A226DFE4_FOLCA|nr:uncharacterized protein LOC110858639 isoform X2 [Folsomia candida]XP_021963162.1 uncharacterized protein LOC110858639 isoform X2 [Folsomia candida]OXA43574.1 hypothetical protein Fcan01_21658 [Folsomia candida]
MDMDNQQPVSGDSSLAKRPFYMTESKEPLLKVQDIPQCVTNCQGVPPHIQMLMSIKGDQDFISVHEFSARLCHILLVETGFFPVTGDVFQSTGFTFTPQALMDMPDSLRIPEFSRKMLISSMFSQQGIYALKYKVILCELVPESVENSGDDKSTGESSEAKPSESGAESVWQYNFSNDINVTMLFTEDRLNITAVCNMGVPKRTITQQLTLNIEEFFTQRAIVVPVRLRGDQWMRKFDINYTRLSVYFKNKFAIILLDQMDGILLERRGLFSLPYLALIKILKKSDVITILRMSKTCTCFYNIVRDNRLWEFLLKRDFPTDSDQPTSASISSRPPPPPPPLPGIMAPPPTPAPRSTTPTEPSSPPATDNQQKLKSDEDPNYYEIYKQKYASKHRRLHRMNSFPIRFFPTLRINRRIPSIPFHFDRF